jgi:pyrroloquinoline quinone (PQQ) biosynthesis protein C
MSFNVQALKLRAQANGHRHYEIYVFTSNEDITKEDIQAWFTEHPQSFADWVRKNHSYKIWDERAREPAVIV